MNSIQDHCTTLREDLNKGAYSSSKSTPSTRYYFYRATIYSRCRVVPSAAPRGVCFAEGQDELGDRRVLFPAWILCKVELEGRRVEVEEPGYVEERSVRGRSVCLQQVTPGVDALCRCLKTHMCECDNNLEEKKTRLKQLPPANEVAGR